MRFGRALLLAVLVAAVGIACGENLAPSDDGNLPGRDGGKDDANIGGEDASGDQTAAGDADVGDAAANDPEWQCATPQPSADYGTFQLCNNGRFSSSCDASVFAPEAGSPCEPDAQAAQTFCTSCRQINTTYRFDTVACTCPP